MIRNKRQLVFAICLILLILTVLIVGYLNLQNQSDEMLVLWGKRDGQCYLWLFDPQSQGSIEADSNNSTCNYDVSKIGGQDHIVHLENQTGKITAYRIDRDGELSVESVIALGQIELTSLPQWKEEEVVFFSGIFNNEENIYQGNNQQSIPTIFVDSPDGMTYTPILSPDGKYLAYWVKEGVANNHECRVGCGAGYYYIIDTNTRTEITLKSFIESSYPHDTLRLSPDSKLIAFTTLVKPPNMQRVIVFDVIQSQVLTDFPVDGGIYGWLSDTELVYTDLTFFPSYEDSFPRYKIFSTQTLLSRELGNFPIFNNNGFVFFPSLHDWTRDGRYFVGTVPASGEEPGVNLIIADMSEEPPNIRELPSEYQIVAHFYSPALWSPLGNWIAADSGNYEDATKDVIVVDKSGAISYTAIENATQLNFAWISP
jgi:hypothetical protein